MYHIYKLIDPETGEVVMFTPELADQVQELVEAKSRARPEGCTI